MQRTGNGRLSYVQRFLETLIVYHSAFCKRNQVPRNNLQKGRFVEWDSATTGKVPPYISCRALIGVRANQGG